MALPSSLPSSRVSKAHRFGAGAVLAAGAFIGPPVAVFAPLGLAPLFGVVALAVLALDVRRTWRGARSLPILAVLLAALGIWAVASMLWSIAPSYSLAEGLRLLTIEAGGFVIVAAATALRPDEGRTLGGALVAGASLALVLLLVEWTSDGAISRLVLDPRLGTSVPLQRFDRGATTFVLALWPALAVLIARRQIAKACLVVVLAGIVVASLDSHAAILALAVGIVAFGVARLLPRVVAVLLALALVATTVALPLVVPSFDETVALHQRVRAINPSALHRLFIWRFVGDRIAERPLLGWGMDAARYLPGGQLDLASTFPTAQLPDDARVLPLHPHDGPLEWRVDLGIPGAVLVLAILLWALWRVGFRGQASALRRAAMLAWASSAIVVGSVSYGFWQAWWLSCLWLGAAFLTAPGTDAPAARDDH
jgi:O-antigen ligase